ncbi:Mitochondrial distribution and morphology protein 34 [Venustampulla echinocandica]|uniref:Mitochondrial distribution and morphology protein 34 n=1 Tax=Venustampulla echinocandica TaxID=2656787 RepID=A0A370TPH1_9HELO|nr:Mitochondrial distribution and morphology protein 34 [Venustampulla echinocandica]RDL37419.1 Mitochondrial distribution and morphology protein 34 [Venustampulla echinocandica]
MAFNFNWSPLTADAEFYQRAKEMLTTALNKSPKPPIIVDDILVNELNLGSVPPELEILEVGDLAEDRFRGIFKMCYSGDAFLTLQTRVQANPLNTYLFSKPSFTSPQPLAASSGLTIPLQITLSEIKLSAFIILVFSKQKGLTLVFRNDPLESLKVSSTFDSIPFVRDYLQKEIEMQLRTLMMDELPAIIHRLSLRLWCPEYMAKEDEERAQTEDLDKVEVVVDPFGSPPQDAVDARGNVLHASEISSLSLDGSSEITSLFSQKNLLRLAALNDSHRTLSLFTPSIRDTVFRAWAGPFERGDSAGTSTPVTPSLVRSQSSICTTSTTYTFNKGSDDGHGHMPSRPSLVSLNSATTGLGLGAGRHSRSHLRKKKNRVVNLRKSKTTDDITSESGESEGSMTPASEPAIPTRIPEEPEDNIITPPRSPSGRVRFRTTSIDLGDSPRKLRLPTAARPALASQRVPEQAILDPTSTAEKSQPTAPIFSQDKLPSYNNRSAQFPAEKNAMSSTNRTPYLEPAPMLSDSTPPGILEQAWVLKMAGEMARRAHDQKVVNQGFWASQPRDEREDSPPPAYEPNVL